MKVAVMQPYSFPYLGYFQLVHTVDLFVFCDDVTYIKGGWIHRNRILLRGVPYFISFPVRRSSQNKWIRDLEINKELKEFNKIIPTLRQAYGKAPYFKEVFPIIEPLISSGSENLAKFAANTVMGISEYLELNTSFCFSSEDFAQTKGLDKSDRLIQIVKELGGTQYINPIGGQELYDKHYFQEHGVTLNFLDSKSPSYPQFDNPFVPHLSMLDVLMFNSKKEVQDMLQQYRFI